MAKIKVLILILSAAVLCSFSQTAHARVYTGLELFLKNYTHLVRGKRVGLITNQTGVNTELESTIDLLHKDRRVNLVALFAPEHGVRGDVRAGIEFSGGVDRKTKLPVYSLYGGGNHKPSRGALGKVDILIYDIQDVGSRAYTYIWHLAKCMEAARENGKEVLVLDRPDPFGGTVVDGPVTQDKYRSFIGLYPVPRVYGMTVGELAKYLNSEEKIYCKLGIVPMHGYRRGMSWKQTGLPWVPTSPHIPDPNSAYAFAATGIIGETGLFNTGVGYTLPFQCVAAPWISAGVTTRKLNSLGLPGVKFRPIYYKPFYGKYKEQAISGVQLHITNPAMFRPATTEVALLCHFKRYYKEFKWNSSKNASFDKAMGNEYVRLQIQSGKSFKQITRDWDKELHVFRINRAKHLIYK